MEVKSMSEKPAKEKTVSEDAEEIKQILGAVSTEIPALIRSIISAVFSEDAGKSMGRAAAAFYKELKDSGMPDNVAVKMTEEYIGVFTGLGDLLKRVGQGKGKIIIGEEKAKEIGEEIEKRIKEKLAERKKAEAEEEEE